MGRHVRRTQPVVGYRPTPAMQRAREQIAAGTQTKPSPWYQIKNNGNVAEVLLYDEIGFCGVTAQDFVAELQALKNVTLINLRISSPGGDVFDGISIFNALRRHPAKVTTYVDGLAASAASFIAQAGDRVVIEPNASMMIHEANGVCVGSVADMREMADLLDRVSSTIASIYASAAGGSAAEWRTAMKAETWYTAEEAVAARLADEVLQPAEPRNGNPAGLREFAARLEWERVTAGLRATPNVDDLLRNLAKKNRSK